ncbi:MAG: hemolysin III family protein [Anaerolineales bacterium]|nr:hemolysin III family protein [Anaerolineales bacterium]MCB8953507.1 hemolysin III family protein [Ardenticatenales bacterium]
MDKGKEKRKGGAAFRAYYSRREELLNSVTHGVGALLSVAGMFVLVVMAATHGDARRTWSFAIYGGSLILLYLASTLYHSVTYLPAKRILRIFDHSAVYVLIAGTYTPFLLVTMRGPLAWTLFATVWGMALVGIIYKAVAIHRYENLSTVLYVAMGWMGVLGFRQIAGGIDPAGIAWLLAGGVIYTAGVLFFAFPKVPYNHAIWHLFVLGGSACHFLVMVRYVMPA